MSTESKAFWLDYQKRNGTIDVPELLDLYAAAKDAEISELNQWQNESIRLASEIQKMYGSEMAHQVEIKRLREGIEKANEVLFPFTGSIRSAKNMLKSLLSPAEPEKEEKPKIVCKYCDDTGVDYNSSNCICQYGLVPSKKTPKI